MAFFTNKFQFLLSSLAKVHWKDANKHTIRDDQSNQVRKVSIPYFATLK